ncbi:hypothetical protein ACQUWM_03595 [Marinobacter sp. DUT-3]|uniref:hypothetical protein n=1 Tax=Marinobacter sp. DUT-3 TaxID=3412036 RepID=UPI003D17EF23
MIKNAESGNYVRPLLGIKFVQKLIKARIANTVKGPDEAARATMPTFVWGEATNGRGEKKTARIRTANGYSLTITGSLAVIEHLMENQPTGGAYTPSSLFGADLITRLPESGDLVIH